MLRALLRVLGGLEPNRHFLKLWASQLLSLTAFNMINFTLLIRVYELTESSTLVSLFILSFGLPSLLFGAIAGVFADRWNRRTVLIVTSLTRAFVALTYLAALEFLPAIYAATFIMATVTQFFTPAEGALIPELVERKRLVAANAIFMMTMFASFVLGYGLAGPLAATGGDQLPIAVGALMFALATIACLLLPKLQTQRHRVGVRAAYGSVFSHLKEGFRYVAQRRVVRYGLWQLTFVWATIGVIMVVLPAFTAKVLGLNLREVSRLIIMPIGIGMLFGGYLLHRARKQFRVSVIVVFNLVLAGLAIMVIGQIRPVSDYLIEMGFGSDPGVVSQFVTSGASAVLGITFSVVMIAAQTLIHEHTTAEVRGRIFGVLGMSINAANTLPVLAAGLLTDLFSVTTVITGVGGGLAAWAILSALAFRQKKIVDTPG